jgi:hypothetical protein
MRFEHLDPRNGMLVRIGVAKAVDEPVKLVQIQ